MNSLDDFLAKFATTAPKDFLESFTKWVPPVDVSDQKGSIVIRADVPGVRKSDLSVEINSGALVITGSRPCEKKRAPTEEDTNNNSAYYYHTERNCGSFVRRVPLPRDIDSEKVQAALNEGVLEVKIAKVTNEAKVSRRIDLQ